MSDSQSQSEYSGRLQEIRKRLRASRSVATSKLQSQLAETIEKNDYHLHLGMGSDDLRTYENDNSKIPTS